MHVKFYVSKMNTLHRPAIRPCGCSQQYALDPQEFKKVDLVLNVLTTVNGNAYIHAEQDSKNAPLFHL